MNQSERILQLEAEVKRYRKSLEQVGELAALDGILTANLEDFLSAALSPDEIKILEE